MPEAIGLPYRSNMAPCYETIRQSAPGLWLLFEQTLLAVANSDLPPEERLAVVGRRADEMWTDFITANRAQAGQVQKSSWWCCVGDLAQALVDQAIPAITRADDPSARKRERLESLRGLVRGELAGAPNSMMMNLDVQGALAQLPEG